MTTRAKVAVLRTSPESVIEDYDRLLGLGEVEKHLPKDTTVILKDNISWHYPMPSANTTSLAARRDHCRPAQSWL